MNRFIKGVVLTLSFAVLAFVGIGYLLGMPQEDRGYRALGVYTEVLQHIRVDYVEDPNLALVTAGALHGLLESLDPLSGYMSPAEYTDYKTNADKNARGETGLTLSKRFGYILVVSVLPDSPAERAGLRNFDILENIAGFSTREMSVAHAKVLLAGEPGTSVNVGMVRRGRTEPLSIDITRAELKTIPVQADLLKEPDAPASANIAYLRVPSLAPGRAAEIRGKLAQLDRQGARRLILDLRGTAAGPFSEGIAVAQLFLSKGKISTLRGQTVPASDASADPAKVAWNHPVTVLISGNTQGAAEILAAAIGGNDRGRLVGERTFGSASEQKIITLDDGAALVLTVANYFTPAGKNISEAGVSPGVEVARASSEFAAADEEATAEAEPPASLPLHDDPVIKKAIELFLQPAPGGTVTEHRAPKGASRLSALLMGMRLALCV